jgi:hypothetical protein
MKKVFLVAGIILLVMGLAGACAKKDEQQQGKNVEKTVEPKPVETPKPVQQVEKKVVKEEQMITGTVRHSDLEGGFYELAADSGERYDPVNLPAEYKKDGLRVKFQIKEKKDMVGIHMRGKIVEVVKIEKL